MQFGRCVFGEAGLTNRNVSEVRSVSSSSLRDLATSESQNGLKIVRRTLMGLSFSTAAAPPVSQIFDLASKSGTGTAGPRRRRRRQWRARRDPSLLRGRHGRFRTSDHRSSIYPLYGVAREHARKHALTRLHSSAPVGSLAARLIQVSPIPFLLPLPLQAPLRSLPSLPPPSLQPLSLEKKSSLLYIIERSA